MKSIVLKEDKDDIISMYDMGYSMTMISRTLNFPHHTVKAIIKKYTGHYTERKVIEKIDWTGRTLKQREELDYREKKRQPNPDRIIKLYKLGNSIHDIVCSEQNVTSSEVKSILRKEGLLELTQEEKDTIAAKKAEEAKAPTVKNINTFKKTIKTGDKFRVYKNKCIGFNKFVKICNVVTVIHPYPNFAQTDMGSYQYFDLFVGDKIN